MGIFSPSTTVYAPLPLRMKRNAANERLQRHQQRVCRGPLPPILLVFVSRIDQPEHAPLSLAVEPVHVRHGLNRFVERRPFPYVRQHRGMRVFAVGGHICG